MIMRLKFELIAIIYLVGKGEFLGQAVGSSEAICHGGIEPSFGRLRRDE